jgi:hypothetical protein
MRSKTITRAAAFLFIPLLALAWGASWCAAAPPSDESLALARRLVQLKPLDYKTIAQIMEVDCLQSMAGSPMGKRLDLEDTKVYCQVVGEVFWAQVKDQVNEAMAMAYAQYLSYHELEVIVGEVEAKRAGRDSKFSPREVQEVATRLAKADPGIKAETAWQIKQITRHWQERFALDNYFKKQFRAQVLEKLPWKIRSKIAY